MKGVPARNSRSELDQRKNSITNLKQPPCAKLAKKVQEKGRVYEKE